MLKLSEMVRCPTHLSPLKMGKVEDITIIWCAHCRKAISGKGETIWIAYYFREVMNDEKQS